MPTNLAVLTGEVRGKSAWRVLWTSISARRSFVITEWCCGLRL